MNKRDQDLPLGDLPAPASPEALDARILEQARAATPARTPRWRGAPWVSGFATASIFAVALLVIVPAQDESPATIVEAAKTRTDSAGTHYSALPDRDAGLAARVEHPSPAAELVDTEQRRAEEPAMGAPTAALHRREIADLRVGAGMAESEAVVARSGKPEDFSERQLLAESAASRSLRAAKLSGPALLRELERCQERADVAADDSETCYQALRKRCKHCDLPDTLNEALEKHRAKAGE